MATRPVSDFVLERYALGELEAHRVPELEARIAADPDVAERLRAIRASDAEVLEALPAADVAREVERRLHLEQASDRHAARAARRWWLATGTVVASAAAVLLFFVVMPERGSENDGRALDGKGPSTFVDRAKGDPQLLLHLKRDARVAKLEAGATARPGDLVQISYRAAGRGHGVVLSIDGGGAVTLHHPVRPDGSTALEGGGAVGLEHSYELDDAPDYERFFFVTSGEPIDVTDLQSRARALAADAEAAREDFLEVPGGLEQTSFLLRKESPR